MKAAEWAMGHLRPIVFLTAVLCLAGAILYFSFPVSILPDVTFPRVVVVADAGDRPAKMMEASVTRPIEEAVATVPNVKRIRSKTKPGSTEISVDFLDGTDIIQAEQLVNAKVNQIRSTLPPETATEVERMNATVFPVLGLTVKSGSLTQTELWNLAAYTIKPRLARVDGVARVVVQGGRPPEIEVVLRRDALAANRLSSSDIVSAVQSSNLVHAAGRITRNFQQFEVVINSEKQGLSDLGGITVARHNGIPVHLSDVAEIRSSTVDRTTVVSANGSESVLVNLVRQPTANSVAMVEAVNRELKALKSSLPSGVNIGLYYDQSVLIREAVNSVTEAVLIGAGLSVLVLMAFLRSWRATLVTASIIPITLLITLLLMRLAGLTLNLMTLGALAVGIGLIIDDAIVVVEAVYRHLGRDRSAAEAVKAASSSISAPMISSTLTTVVVFLPLAYLQGVSGAFFLALAVTLAIALMVSLGLALCVSPSLCSAFLKYREGLHDGGAFFGWVEHGCERLLKASLRHKWLVLPAIALTTLAIFWAGSHLQSGFMPELDEGAFVLDYWSPPGTSLEESDRLLTKVDKILMATPEITTFSRRTGTELGFAITEGNRGDYAVMLKPGRRRRIEDVMGGIRSQIQAEIPGLDVEFIQVLQDLIGDLAGNASPIEVKFFGEDKEEVEKAAAGFADRLSQVKGLVDVNSGVIEGSPEIQFLPNESEIGRRGLTDEQLSSQMEASLYGTVATEVMVADRQIPVRVRLPNGARSSLEALKALQIASDAGPVQLGDLGEFRTIPGTTQSSREDQRRVAAVTASLEGIDLGTAARQVQEKIDSYSLPAGVTVSLAGQFRSQQESFQNMTLVLGASVLLVFTVMLFQFGRFEAPLVILILMPLGLCGAALALWLTGTALNVSSFMGVIMLAGIVVKNGILLLDQAQASLLAGMDVQDAVLQAVRTRLRPILMTTLTAILGLVPLALGIGAGAEMQKPLAVAVVGGLLFSTVLTLWMGPLMFAAAMERRARRVQPPEQAL